jgi:putative hydrolase of the HAD superfamily
MTIFSKFDLFVFDLDDTLIKTEHYHYNAWLKTIKLFVNDSFNMTFSEFTSIFHSIKEGNIKNYIVNQLKINNYTDVIKTKSKIYCDLIMKNKDELKMIDGADEFITKILENNKKFVIVTNSPKEQIELLLDIFEILKKSKKIYYREMFQKLKPNPECYLKVLEDFPNNNVVGFEDSITGIHALTSANILTYYVNESNYSHNKIILENYKVIPINNYKNFLE